MTISRPIKVRHSSPAGRPTAVMQRSTARWELRAVTAAAIKHHGNTAEKEKVPHITYMGKIKRRQKAILAVGFLPA
ncbi:hypothetical protein [Paenibacillus fonticola]|uniref:hypothetical protein n=1 Tax=Paenibacillus fonticola TaxID=379896 RepID=UPI0012FC3315|nr:hypothetical protein [Paenibacillus fonticola]